ncbi:MAG: delta-60 repeat domain-containing protein [Flavobacteriales bacterium]|nr:delta-60 repeat domain-containing protein [Flavobacteriales bacterium]
MIQDEGKLIVAGRFDTYNGNSCGNIARLNTDGTFDPSFTTGSGFGSSGPDAPWVDYLAHGIGGKVVVSGPFTSYNGIACNGTVQLNADGTRDMGFAPVNYTRGPLAVQSDGKVIVDGGRLNVDGSTDLSWLFEGVSHNGSVGLLKCLTLQPDGRLLIGGWFTHVGLVPRNGIARLNPDGSLDTGFDPGSGVGDVWDGVRTIALQSDGRVVIGGLFTDYDGTPRQGLARLESDGALDVTFEPGTGFGSLPELGSIGYVNALALTPAHKPSLEVPSHPSMVSTAPNRMARILISGDECLALPTHHHRRSGDQLRRGEPEAQWHQHHCGHRSARCEQVPVPLHQHRGPTGLCAHHRLPQHAASPSPSGSPIR